MEKTLEGTSPITLRATSNRIIRGLGWGLIGGLAGTLFMDLVLMAALAAFGLPVLSCFSIVGNTVVRFLSLQNLELAGIIRLGVAVHYLVGPLVGAIFGGIAARAKAFHGISLKKSILLAILYVEILSQPLLAMASLLLKMTPSEALQWYGGGFAMHLLLAVILGTVVGCGLRLADQTSSRRA